MFNFVESSNEKYRIDLEYIENLEKSLNIEFPDVLRDYYLKHNGDSIKECRFKIYDLIFCVVLITPLKYGTMPVEKILGYNAENDAIPETFIPLALDEDEDDYYWDSQTGVVYYLSLENVEHPIPICESVEKFFEILNAC